MWTPIDALELLEELDDLRFPDELFRRIHPKRHSMVRYHDYCQGLKRFTRSSSSQILLDRMHTIIATARTQLSEGLSEPSWSPIVDDAIEKSARGARGYRRLDEPHQRFIAEQIAKLVEVAIDRHHPMRWVAGWQIRNTLWRWTVDGVATNGAVFIDAAKVDLAMWPISEGAAVPGAVRVHEHVVPRAVITRHLIRNRVVSVDQIIADLRRLCLAAVVTEDEDDELDEKGFRESMPHGWQWEDDPWARYRSAGLFERMRFPPDWPH